MDRDNLDQVITVTISGLSLLVSVYVLWRQRRGEGQAHFTAEWEDRNSLVYLNHGPGAARNVRVMFESQMKLVDETIPYVGAFQTMRIGGIVRTVAESPTQTLGLSWKDNRRRRQHANIHLPEPPQAPHRPPTSSRDALEKTVRDIAREEAREEIATQVRKVSRRPRRPS